MNGVAYIYRQIHRADFMLGNQIWHVSFLKFDLGYFDKERDRVEPAPNPFVPEKVLTMSLV